MGQEEKTRLTVPGSVAHKPGHSPTDQMVHAGSEYSLTSVQEAMLYHSLASDARDLYIVQQRIEIEGSLDVSAFCQAWDYVFERHPALRTTFSWSNDQPPASVVHPNLKAPIEVFDLTQVLDPEAEIAGRYLADRDYRYQLDEPPLMRIALFVLDGERSVLLWSQHHLLQDGWSAANVLEEVFSAYTSLHQGEAPALESVRPFRDYIDWLQTRDDSATELFWREHLSGFAEPTRMSRIGEFQGSGGYERRSISLTSELTGKLSVVAREAEVTLNTVLIAGLAVVLSRHGARDDVAFGIVASGRPPELAGIESMVGMFINTLAMRIEIDPESRVFDFLLQVQRCQSAVLDHGHSALPDVQAWSELGSGVALTDVLFAYWNFGGSGESPDGAVKYRTLDGYGRTSFPFSITVEGSDPLRIGVDFDVADVRATDAERFLRHLAEVLESMAAVPQARVRELGMLSETEHRENARFDATRIDFEHRNVLAAFKAAARRFSDSIAIESRHIDLTYSQVDQLTDALALRLLEQTSFKPPRIALLGPRSPQLLVGMIATLKSGGSYVPIESTAPIGRIRHMVADSDADAVLTLPQHLADLDSLGLPVIALDSLDSPPEAGLSIDMPVAPDDPAYVMYTSGSTGRPKGVMVSHGNLANYVSWAVTQYSPDGPSDFPLFTSIGFDLTLTSILVPLVTGGKVLIYEETEEAIDLSVLRVFEEDRVDVVKLTPAHLSILQPEHLSANRIRALVLGGEDLKTDLALRVFKESGGTIKVFNEYGPTEATVGCMIHEFDPEVDTDSSVPIGHPIANTSIRIAGPSMSWVPTGRVGEIVVGGAGVAAGYLNEAELTAESFFDDTDSGGRLYRTGDLGRVTESGHVEFVGRLDDQVKVRGYRIEPGELENVLREHPAIADAAVAVRTVDTGDVRLVAYYVPYRGSQVNVTTLRTHVRDRLPAFMVPQGFHRIEALPLTANGKTDRRSLPMALGEVGSTTSYLPPQTPSEHLVADHVAQLLSIEQVGMNDNFFDLGGHSILAMQLITRLFNETGMRIKPRVILLDTLGQAAALLTDVRAPQPQPAAPNAVAESSIGTYAYFFGPADEQLFGIRYNASADADPKPSVLICPPLGWEYMRTHWALRKLARQLAADGHHVLRFDYFGTGDSAGVPSQGSVKRWVADLEAAASELIEATGQSKVSLVGVRLGATFAALAARRIGTVSDLVLWDPVVEGSQYLARLQEMHSSRLHKRKGPVPFDGLEGEDLLGFALPTALRNEISSIDLAALGSFPARAILVASQDRVEYRKLAESKQVRLEVIADSGAWDSVASTESALLPTAIPPRIVELLGAKQ